MADVLKVLGQAKPAATTLTTLYTVPSTAQTTTSSLVACNSHSGNSTTRISIAINGAADDLKQYIYYDHQISAKESHVAVLGMTLNEGDVVRVYSDSGNVSFNLFGVETIRD
jgi:hypothetical protein